MNNKSQLGLPALVGDLPEPLSIEDSPGRRFCRQVTVLGKRKRSEIVTAIDRQAVEVRSVQPFRTLASVSVPVDERFVCPPCCAATETTRYIYAAFTNERKIGLKCYPVRLTDEKDEWGASQKLENNSSHYAHSSEVPVQSLHICPVQGPNDFALLVLYKDGSFAILSKDLATTFRAGKLNDPLAPGHALVHFAEVVHGEGALQRLFQGREDLISATTDYSVLVLVYSNSENQYLSLWSFHDPNDGGKLLISPPSILKKLHTKKFALHTDSGLLFRSDGHRLDALPVSKPSMTDTLVSALPSMNIDDFELIGHDLVLIQTKSVVQIFDLTYGSLQSVIDLVSSADAIARNAGQKGKRLFPLKLVTPFVSEGLVLGIAQQAVLAFQIPQFLKEVDGRPKSYLIDCIGKSAKPNRKDVSALIVPMPNSLFMFGRKAARKILSSLRSIHECLKSNNDEHLETRCHELIESLSSVEPSRNNPLDLVKALIALSFTANDSEGTEVSLGKCFPFVFNWIIDSYELTVPLIESVIFGSSQKPPPGWFARLLVDKDPTILTLLDVLISPMRLEVAELLSATSLLVESLGFCNTSPSYFQNYDTDSESLMGADQSILQLQQEAASQDLDLAIMTLESGSHAREQALTAVLIRLAAFEPSTIVQEMSSTLTKAAIIDIIHLLRMQLRNGGWLTTYQDLFEELSLDSDEAVEHQSILVICKVIDCALRSIGLGVSAFENVQERSGETMEDVLISLKAEISAVLEGIQEATYLNGILGQLNVYAGIVREREYLPGNTGMLPLTVQDGGHVASTVKRLDGRTRKRSGHELAKLHSMQVPQYSIDRIEV